VRAERLRGARPERLCEQRGVAQLEIAVEREVVAGQRHVVIEQQLQPPAHGGVDPARRAVPEDPVVGEDEPGAQLGRALEQLGMGGDAGHDDVRLGRPRHLEAVGPVVAVPLRLEPPVEMRQHVGHSRHRQGTRSARMGFLNATVLGRPVAATDRSTRKFGGEWKQP
jgi:hypothetical protein